MRKLFVITMLLAMACSLAAAAEKPVHGPAHILPLNTASRAVGDDCSAPIVVDLSVLPYSTTDATCGRGNNLDTGCLGSYDGGEDVFYQLDVAADGYFTFALTSSDTWTGLGIATECTFTDCVDMITGSSADKLLEDVFLAAGSYYLMLDTYPSPNCIASYTLDITAGTAPPPPPANDLCEGAIAIGHGAFSIDGDLSDANDDYTPGSGGCTGYGATGPDLVYTFGLEAGESFEVTMTTDGFDDSIYLVTDCADPAGSCVAGSDLYPDGSNFSFTATEDVQLYLIVDAYSGAGGVFNITGVNGGNVVGNEDVSFSSLKASFR